MRVCRRRNAPLDAGALLKVVFRLGFHSIFAPGVTHRPAVEAVKKPFTLKSFSEIAVVAGSRRVRPRSFAIE